MNDPSNQPAVLLCLPAIVQRLAFDPNFDRTIVSADSIQRNLPQASVSSFVSLQYRPDAWTSSLQELGRQSHFSVPAECWASIRYPGKVSVSNFRHRTGCATIPLKDAYQVL